MRETVWQKWKKKDRDAWSILFLLLLCAQLVLLIRFNLSDIRYSLDADFANTVYHFRQVIAQGTIALPDWYNTTSLELDGSFLFALPLYYLLHNIFLAVGIANLLFIALYIRIVTELLQCAGVQRRLILFTLCLLLTPYSFGMLEYFNMLFFAGACYSMKVLVPLLLILLLAEQPAAEFRVRRVLQVLLFLFLLFMTVFSTGFYVLLCGILPVFLGAALQIWKQGGPKPGQCGRKNLSLLTAMILTAAAGYAMHQHYYGLASRTDMKLTKLDNLAVNFRGCIAGLFQVFGAVPSDDIKAMSPQGILYCLRIGAVILLLLAFAAGLKRLFRTDAAEEKDPEDDGRAEVVRDYKKATGFIISCLTILFLFNFLIVLVSDTRYSGNTNIEYRYLLIGMVPLIPLLGIILQEKSRAWNPFQSRCVFAVLFLAAAMLIAGSDRMVSKNWDRSGYAVELSDYFKTQDLESVFFIDDPDTMDFCRAIDGSHKYGWFNSADQKLELTFCSYNAAQYGNFFGNKNAIAVINLYGKQLSDHLPQEIAQHYTKTGSVEWFDIYTADQVYFPSAQ
jgi:hypothetical protein